MIYWPDIAFPPINLWSVWKRDKMITSPCKRECLYNCRLGYCESCGRTLEEISRWEKYGDSYKQEIRRRAKERLNGQRIY